MLFHARGLVNTKAIQNNLDWVWPYWVERQFNPADTSFIPRCLGVGQQQPGPIRHLAQASEAPALVVVQDFLHGIGLRRLPGPSLSSVTSFSSGRNAQPTAAVPLLWRVSRLPLGEVGSYLYSRR